MRIILFLVLILFVALLFSLPKDMLSKKSKIVILICAIAVFITVFTFNEIVQNRQDKIQVLVQDFLQKKSIKCGDYVVDNVHFNYEYGTQSFVAKREFSSLNGVIISINQCIKD